jgi:hypothetical protein
MIGNSNGRDHLRDIEVDGRNILKLSSEQYSIKWGVFYYLKTIFTVGSCKHGETWNF